MHALVAFGQAHRGLSGHGVMKLPRDYWLAVVGSFAELAQQHELQEAVDVVVVPDARVRIRADRPVEVGQRRRACQKFCRVER
ncbi:hypothetical protein D3C72_2076040 [compost metagenome]